MKFLLVSICKYVSYLCDRRHRSSATHHGRFIHGALHKPGRARGRAGPGRPPPPQAVTPPPPPAISELSEHRSPRSPRSETVETARF
jgi:hypothetical protein